MLALQGSSDPGVLEVNQEVLPIPPVSKMAKVEGCIQMYEEIYRMKGRVNRNKSVTDPKPLSGTLVWDSIAWTTLLSPDSFVCVSFWWIRVLHCGASGTCASCRRGSGSGRSSRSSW